MCASGIIPACNLTFDFKTKSQLMESPVHKILGKQFLITSFADKKLQIVNFIKSGYDQNKPILTNNAFLHFTAHLYYRSVIIDLYALYSGANRNNKNSFFAIDQQFKTIINPMAIDEVFTWLEKAEQDIRIIKELRDQQIAHYDFNIKEAISLNFNNLDLLNRLEVLSKKIISHLAASFIDIQVRVSYDFERKYHELQSLERLLKAL